MNPWLKHIRKIVYLLCAALGGGVYFYVIGAIPSETLQNIRLGEWYGFIAVILLYVTLLASPLYKAFPNFPFRSIYLPARPALGVSSFFFAAAHGFVALFGSLGGFAGLGFLSGAYMLNLTAAAVALLILTAMAVTSNKYSMAKLGKVWKRIHNFVHLAGLLIIIHVVTLGAHFADLSRAIPQIFFYALLFLLVLEALRLDKSYQVKSENSPRFGPVFVISISVLTLFGSIFLIPNGGVSSIGIHSQHLQQAQTGGTAATSTSLTRYTVSLVPPDDVQPNQPAILKFKIFDADTGGQVTKFAEIYTKLMHLVVVDSGLESYQHLHPELQNGEFTVAATFPTASLYHLYLNFQPTDGQEQQFALTLPVGSYTLEPPSQSADANLTKTFGDYTVTLASSGKFLAKDLSIGLQPIDFRIVGARTGAPVKDIKPYLGAFGHLVMINEQTYEYVHIHPSAAAAGENASAGPDISFVPHALFSPLKPGTYRVFLQINPNGNLILADYTIRVE